MAKGIAWQRVDTTRLSKELQKKYAAYENALATANALATELKTALKTEWNDAFPTGQNGKVASFNITGGTLQVAMVTKADLEQGVDVFARPVRQ